ncbi:MAG: hypothetical protein JO224_12900 [Pelomonas sp.]|nr:hypothetical protein [Roseateles sp.]
MNILRVLLVVCAAGGGYTYWKHHPHDHAGPVAYLPTDRAVSFAALPPVDGQRAATVYVVAAQNCPHDDARRADRLADDLSHMGIPVERTHEARFHFTSRPDAAVMDRMKAIMTGPLPIVFVNGRAKANPSLDEVAAEFRAGRAS